MRVLPLTLLLFTACHAPRVAERTAVVPLGPAIPAADVARDAGVPAAADRSPPAPMAETAPAAGGSVTWRTVTQVTEVPAAAPAGAAPSWSSGTIAGDMAPYDPGYAYGYGYGYERRRARETWFPYGTAIGIGLGSAFDHRHHGWRRHHHHHGAWIGGTLGLLFDLGRWSR